MFQDKHGYLIIIVNNIYNYIYTLNIRPSRPYNYVKYRFNLIPKLIVNLFSIIGLYRENAIAIQDEVGDSNGGNV